MVPILALGVGTWVGLGRPDARAAAAEGQHAFHRVTSVVDGGVLPWSGRQGKSAFPGEDTPPPAEDRPTTVDTNAVPDPRTPWPQLNPQASREKAWLIAEGPARHVQDPHHIVTFTFDDGPFPETAPTLLRILRDHQVRATFFFIGKYLDGDKERARLSREVAVRIAAEGHFIGNHTSHHKVLTTLSHAAALAEIDNAASSIERATGVRPVLFRPPYGQLDPWLEGAVRQRGLELQLWSVDVEDMKRGDPDEIAEVLRQQLEYKGGGMVLLHDMRWPSVRAFNRLLRWLEAHKWDAAHPKTPGWEIVDLAEYLRRTAENPQPFARREDLEKARLAEHLKQAEALRQAQQTLREQ
jgi:peptidoglycan/xylan/chitin deacetylase (PgdA/CDA1 family)